MKCPSKAPQHALPGFLEEAVGDVLSPAGAKMWSGSNPVTCGCGLTWEEGLCTS